MSGENYEPILNESTYKVDMMLRIRSVGPADIGSYKCVAKNSLGETDSTIKLYSKYSFHLVSTFLVEIYHSLQTSKTIFEKKGKHRFI